jgi:hypothetical protein
VLPVLLVQLELTQQSLDLLEQPVLLEQQVLALLVLLERQVLLVTLKASTQILQHFKPHNQLV